MSSSLLPLAPSTLYLVECSALLIYYLLIYVLGWETFELRLLKRDVVAVVAFGAVCSLPGSIDLLSSALAPLESPSAFIHSFSKFTVVVMILCLVITVSLFW